MERSDQKVFGNKRTAFGVFLFQPVGTEITVPFKENSYFHFVFLLRHHVSFFVSPNEIATGTNARTFPLDVESLRSMQPKILAKSP